MDYKTEYVEENGLVYEVKTYTSGNKFWFYKGKRHRLNGPAVERVNGDNYYYINNEHFKTFEEYKEAVVQIKINEILNENLGCKSGTAPPSPDSQSGTSL